MIRTIVTTLFFALTLNASAASSPSEVIFTDIDGQSVSLSQTSGKLRVVNFWATWCPPCVREMPALGNLSDQLADSLEVIAINVGEDPTSVAAFLLENLEPSSLQIWLDPEGKSFSTFKLTALPITLILDPEGAQLDKQVGERAWDSPEFIAKFRELAASD